MINDLFIKSQNLKKGLFSPFLILNFTGVIFSRVCYARDVYGDDVCDDVFSYACVFCV